MRRRPRAAMAMALSSNVPALPTFDPSKWLNAEQAAAYLGIFKRKDGKPSVGAIRNLVYRGLLKARKPFGRLLISRSELDRQIETSPTKRRK